MSDTSFRHTAGFGKRMEYIVIAEMLKEGMDVYVPLVDDNGIDAVVRRSDGTFVEVQIKARSNDVRPGDEALFAGIKHIARENYWFIFYSEGVHETPATKEAKPMIWVMSSAEFIASAKIRQGRMLVNGLFGSMVVRVEFLTRNLSLRNSESNDFPIESWERNEFARRKE